MNANNIPNWPAIDARRRASRCEARGRERRGAFAVVTVLVALVICITLFGIWGQSAVRERLQIDSRQSRMQAVRLAEAGLRRAAARRAADGEYEGEDWLIPADALATAHAAVVHIKLSPRAEGASLLIESVAEYPAGSVRHAQATKHWEIKNPSSGVLP